MNIYSINGDPPSINEGDLQSTFWMTQAVPALPLTDILGANLQKRPNPQPLQNRKVAKSNTRKDANKYRGAMDAMRDEFRQFFSRPMGGNCSNHSIDEQKKQFLKNLAEKSGIDAERFYLQHRDDWHIPGMNYDSATAKKNNIYLSLYCALRALDDPEITNIRIRNTEFINHLRAAVESTEYQEDGKRRHIDDPTLRDAVHLIQNLSSRKITGVDLSAVTHNMIESAANASMTLGDISIENIGTKIGGMNEALKEAGPEYEKDWWKLLKQKFQGEFGVNNDTCGKSNVPYVRSIQKLAKKIRVFCRFGTPTIQEFRKPTKIDPIFEAALDAAKRDKKKFLYFNHQRRDGKEGLRTSVIEALQEKYPGTFYCASIPLDGKIIECLNPNCKKHPEAQDIEKFRELVVAGFVNKEHGCNLPIIPGGKERKIVEKTFDRVKDLYFGGNPEWDKKEVREAFWGIFNTELKLAIMGKIDPDYINSACKDNKDRGGTLSTIDEAILLVRLGQTDNPEKLKALVFNALAPYIVKYEAILNNPDKASDHRLGYLIAVLNHIATLSQQQLEKIQEEHQKKVHQTKIEAQYFPQEEKFREALSPSAAPVA